MKWLIVIVFLLICSYRLLATPTGLTVDEAAFGYNAALLAKTGHDENGRFMPVFVNSIEGRDWRQPITQYWLTLLFWLFGPSVFLLRFSSVIIATSSLWLMGSLTELIWGKKYGSWGMLVLASTPLFFIHSRLGLDNLMPVPFTLLFLITIVKLLKGGQMRNAIWAGIALGISFYTYKGMRAILPIWSILTVGALMMRNEVVRIRIKTVLVFGLSLAPFLVAAPLLNKVYPGAIFGGASPSLNNIYELARPYLSSYDPSYLFVTGDLTLYHSTGRHGVLLLASAPLVILGLIVMFRNWNFVNGFLISSLFFAPLLYGMVGSDHRFSRLLCLTPLWAVVILGGIKTLVESKRFVAVGLSFVVFTALLVNIADFYKYYHVVYPGITESLVGKMDRYLDFEKLKIEADRLNLKPVVSEFVNGRANQSNMFFQVIYFGKLLEVRQDDKGAEAGEILLTQRKEIPSNKQIGAGLGGGYLQIRE